MKEGEGKERNSVSFPSSHPFPALLLALFFMRSLTLVPCSLFRNCRETLATQARTLTKLPTVLVVLVL